MIKICFTLPVLMTFVFQFSFGQTELFGTWKVNCPMEKTDGASATFCGLCPISQKDTRSLTISEFEMTVDKNEMKLNMDNVKTSVQYKWDENLDAIEFQYKENKYKFKVLSNGDKNLRILKNETGQIMILTKN